MRNFVQTTLAILGSSLVLAAPTLAEGLVTVEYPNGDSNNYPDVKILSNNEILSVDDGGEGKVLQILKKDCHKEGEVSVCNGGTASIDTYGVKEAMLVKQMVVFTNNTNQAQPIKDSKVTLGPKSVMAEILTQKGTYINISGKIDSAPIP